MDEALSKIVEAASVNRGGEPGEPLRSALNALADSVKDQPKPARQQRLVQLAEIVQKIAAPIGAGYVAVLVGAAVEERGYDPALTVRPLLIAFRRLCRRLPDSGDAAAIADTETGELKTGTNLLGQALVSHFVRLPSRLGFLADHADFIAELERIEPGSSAAVWLLQLDRQRSGELTVLNVEQKAGAVVRYENVSNCFHLFSLLQSALADRMPGARRRTKRMAALALGQGDGSAFDRAWWHFTHADTAAPAFETTVWGEQSPEAISRVDGAQALLLWPRALLDRSWDSSFFGPHLTEAPPSASMVRPLSPAELQHWWERLALKEPSPQRGLLGFLTRRL